jgi:hypothetical protein
MSASEPDMSPSEPDMSPSEPRAVRPGGGEYVPFTAMPDAVVAAG